MTYVWLTGISTFLTFSKRVKVDCPFYWKTFIVSVIEKQSNVRLEGDKYVIQILEATISCQWESLS